MAEKMRVHILAKELSVPSNVIIQKCQAEGLDVTNHMSTLSAGLAATIREWFSEGEHETTLETATRVDLEKVRVRRRKKAAVGGSEEGTESSGELEADVAAPTETAVAVAEEAFVPRAEAGGPTGVEDVVGETIAESSAASAETTAEAIVSGGAEPTVKPEVAPAAAPAGRAAEPEVRVSPAGPQNVPRPAQLKGPRVVRYEAPEESYGRPGVMRRPAAPRPAPAARTTESADAADRGRRRGGRGAPVAPAAEVPKKKVGAKLSERELAEEKIREWRDRDLAERRERISDATGRRIHTHRATETARRIPGAPAARKTEASVQEPILMKDLCAATGISMMQMVPTLRRDFEMSADMNMVLTPEMAELLAAEHGVALKVIPAKSLLDELREEMESRAPVQEEPRPPVVTFLGHVDHGKTSLLDAIRATHVASKEDGGITQHIGAYHLEHKTGGRVTFLDTPGHQAFTAMRARGASMTDIVVLVVAADDGLMPQTEEAISHAKAAGVPVVVALNKIDLGTQNVTKIYGQLSQHDLAPSGDWGGHTDVIETSATKGRGINELVEHLTALGEVLDLKADVGCEAMGTVIEAETKEGVGSVVRVLVQRGTLRRGSILVCGPAGGKVRALLNDRGKQIKEAGPSIPVEIWGFDEVPAAGDRFYEVGSLPRAKTIADETKRRRQTEGRHDSRRMRTLEDVFARRGEGDVPELNVIIRADVDGSLDALKGLLGQYGTDEVRLTIRHTGVGPVTDSDVLLADTSSAIIIAFRVAMAGGAKRLADERGVDIRRYKVIYEVADDMRKALEGLLTPDETIEVRSTLAVREVFRISKVGPVAGCVVSDGTANRNHLVRLTRDGVVVREGSKISSLRRFKEDVREVRAGMECGVRIEGFSDVKAGDVMETYEVVKHARKLEMA